MLYTRIKLFFPSLVLLAATASADEINLLIFGNSYAVGGMRELPKIAEAMGDDVKVTCFRANPRDVVTAIEKEASGNRMPVEEAEKVSQYAVAKEGYVALESNYNARVSVLETLRSRKWDYIVFQCHSSQANDRGVWENDLKSVYKTVREEVPGAEFLLYHTTPYRNDGLLYGTEVNTVVYKKATSGYPYTEDEHYLDTYVVYHSLAKDLGCRVIPGATAFENARYDAEWPYEKFPDPEFDYVTTSTDKPDQTKSLHFGLRWEKNKVSPAGLTWVLDSHPNNIGNYLTGCTYYEMLFKRSAEGCSYKPNEISKEEAAVLQRIAHETVAGKMPPLRLENPKSITRYNDILSQLNAPGVKEAVSDPEYFERCREIWEAYGKKTR